MSITIIIILNIKIHPVLLNFILDLFDLKKDEIDEKKYKQAMIAVHGPSITEKSQLVQVLRRNMLIKNQTKNQFLIN